MCMGALSEHIYVQQMHASHPCRSEEGIGFPETQATDSREIPCRCWELNLGPLPELLFLTTKPTFQSLKKFWEFSFVCLSVCLKHIHFIKQGFIRMVSYKCIMDLS